MNALRYFFDDKIAETNEKISVDVCVYGGTAAGLIAAVRAKKEKRSVVLLHPGRTLGGMTTGGLSFTDIGNKAAIGGLSRVFYRRLGSRYGLAETFKFEPNVAQAEIDLIARESSIDVRFFQYLDGVRVVRRRIHSITLLGGLEVEARAFIDATYEGDLMAKAGVTYTTGREPNAEYGETYNGRQIHPTHQFDCDVDPYVREGMPESGLLPHVGPERTFVEGSGDRRIQAYNFRVCMTDDDANRTPFPKPASYDASEYELARRWLRCTRANVFAKFDRITETKTDTNNHGAVSTDFIGANYRWPEGDFRERERIFQAHVTYQKGLHWFMANDPAVPDAIRREYARWGLAADEFADTGGWPHQLYIREARRMVGEYVVSEHDCTGSARCDDSVGMAAYQMDSHNCARIVLNGVVKNDGDVQVKLPAPYPISFRSIVPS
ncbi:MAG: FAD-dependent oxidoreductase, partial [Spirochaetaceae bacterium]